MFANKAQSKKLTSLAIAFRATTSSGSFFATRNFFKVQSINKN